MAEYIEREALREAFIKHFDAFYDDGRLVFSDNLCTAEDCEDILKLVAELPTADVVEVSKAAEILDDAFGNDYPCNFNDIDEWLPYVCEYANTCDCSSVKCWEQLIKHYGERRCE